MQVSNRGPCKVQIQVAIHPPYRLGSMEGPSCALFKVQNPSRNPYKVLVGIRARFWVGSIKDPSGDLYKAQIGFHTRPRLGSMHSQAGILTCPRPYLTYMSVQSF